MRAMMAAAAMAVAVALATGALATRALAATGAPGSVGSVVGASGTGRLVGMSPALSTGGIVDKNSTAELKQLIQEAKVGVGARMGPQLYILQKAYGAQAPRRDGALTAKLPALRVQDGYVRISAY